MHELVHTVLLLASVSGYLASFNPWQMGSFSRFASMPLIAPDSAPWKDMVMACHGVQAEIAHCQDQDDHEDSQDERPDAPGPE